MHGKHSGQTCQAGEKEALSPRGGGGVGGGVGGVEKKRKKKELGSGLRFFTRKLLIKNKLFLRILAK